MLIALLDRPGSGPWAAMLREIYPLLLLVGPTAQLDVLNAGGVRVHDALVQRWELALFGTQVSREWWRAAPSRFWSTVLHAAYFSYYFIVLIPAFYFLWTGATWPRSGASCWSVMTTFVVCYLVFIFFPVAGPYYMFPRPPPGSSTTPRRGWCTTRSPRAAPTERPSRARTSRPPWPPRLPPRSGSRRLGLVLLVPTVLLEWVWSTARCTTGSMRWRGWWWDRGR